jgi:signal transduction histidine kinase
MQQVLMNLVRNGIDAMDSARDVGALRIRSLVDGDMVRVEVSDCGGGIKYPERMFEPFFTTKESGMGMGLAICRSIIESHDGRLWAMNNEPKGATLAFALPIQASKIRH